MNRSLNVYLNQNWVGQLSLDQHGQMVFAYAENWLANKKAIALS